MVWSESGKDSFARTIGDRVRELRLRRGYRSARELAESIPNNRLTAKVVNNIEIGRKLDLTVVELLELSKALDVAPQQLLVDYRRPYEPTDIPGVSESISKMNVMEFLEWLSLPFEAHPLFMNVDVGSPRETLDVLALRNYDVRRRILEFHLDEVKRALKINRMVPGHTDLTLLRQRAAEASEELAVLARFLQERGISIPRDHVDRVDRVDRVDHSLATTPAANSDPRDHIDHNDRRDSATMSSDEPRR